MRIGSVTEYIYISPLVMDATFLNRENPIKSHWSKGKCVLCHIYFEYLHGTKISLFTIISVIKQAKFHLSGTIIGRVGLFAYVVYCV